MGQTPATEEEEEEQDEGGANREKTQSGHLQEKAGVSSSSSHLTASLYFPLQAYLRDIAGLIL